MADGSQKAKKAGSIVRKGIGNKGFVGNLGAPTPGAVRAVPAPQARRARVARGREEDN